MPSNTTTHDTNANRTRWGGILTICAVVVIATRVTLDLALAPTGLDADHAKAAAFIDTNSGMYTLVSWLGIAGALLASVGAFFLVTRPTSTRHGFPASAFWLVVGVGHLMSLALYTFRGSGFVTLAANQAAMPAAFEAARSTLGLLGPLATITIYGGLVAIFAGEARSHTSGAPSWLSWGISLLSVVGLAGGVLRLVPDAGQIGMTLGYAFYAVGLGLILWSIKVAWPNVSLAWTGNSARHGDNA